MKDVVQTAIECEHCGEYTMFGVVVPDTAKLRAVVDAARAVDAFTVGYWTDPTLVLTNRGLMTRLSDALEALDAKAPYPSSGGLCG